MSLRALQRDFQRWLSSEPAELPRSFGEAQRAGLAVYLNNYRSQLLGCLQSSFPAVRALVGEAAFDAVAAKHIDACPPHSWTLDAYAEGFPDFLQAWTTREPHLGELARLELALATAFVGMDAAPLDAAQLADVDWDAAVIHLSPTFSLLPVTTNVDAIWSAIGGGETPPSPVPLAEAACLAIWRAEFTSRFRAATSAEICMFNQVRHGATFEQVCAELIRTLGEDAGTAAAGAVLGQWLADGVIVGISRR